MVFVTIIYIKNCFFIPLISRKDINITHSIKVRGGLMREDGAVKMVNRVTGIKGELFKVVKECEEKEETL